MSPREAVPIYPLVSLDPTVLFHHEAGGHCLLLLSEAVSAHCMWFLLSIAP